MPIPTADQPIPIVGIGASAGGVEAIRSLIAPLPSNLGMAIVVVVHLDPKARSYLKEVVSSVSALPVEDATDGRRIEPGRIYVIPPDKDLTISCGMLQLSPRRDERRLQDPIDCFLISLAREQGDQAIGVVLSGTGSDGAIGIREVKSCGGITFAQDDVSAKQPAMPRAAIKTRAVDFVLPPEEIGKELVVLSRAMATEERPVTMLPKSEQQAQEMLLSLLRDRTDVDFSHYKQPTIWRRLNRRIAILRLGGVREYLEYCRANASEVESLYQDILINVTSFFRDQEVFEALERKVFPKMLKARSDEEPVRVWVPGCSTGEEAYSLAMTLFEHFFLDKSGIIPVQIFGTDINETVVERARSGLYTERIAETVSPQRLERFFIRVSRGYQVIKPIRDLCVFARQNVVADPPLSHMDLITCRNLLIYLGPTLQRRVIPRLHYALKPDGYLLLGKSEVLDSFSDLFASVDKRTKIYRKKSSTLTNRLDLGTAPGSIMSPMGTTARGPSRPGTVFTEIETQREIDRLIATRYSPPVICINESLDVLQVRGDIKPYLDLGSGLFSMNLSRLVQRDFARKVQELVAQASAGKFTSASLDGLRLRAGNGVRSVNLRFTALHYSKDKDRRFMLVFEPAKTKASAKQAPPTAASPRLKALLQENGRLEEELRLTREYLQSTVDEREIRNEELVAANEEILSSNEELQTMNQELETSKEELESSNEELVTLNEELQTRMEELRLSEERFRILVSGVKDYAIFMLDKNGIIRSWNEGAQRIKGYRADEVIGKHFSLFYRPEEARSDKPQEELRIASRDGAFHEEGIRVRKDGREFWAHVVITPLYDESGGVYGYAKVTRDVTERKKAEESLRLSEERFRILVSGVRDYAIFMMDTLGNILSWNEGAERLTGYRKDEILGKNFSLFYTQEDLACQHPQHELKTAAETGRYEEEGWRVRKDGTRFLAHIVLTALYDGQGRLAGFGKVTQDVTEKRKAEAALRESHSDLARRVVAATATLHQQEAQLRLITNALPSLVCYILPNRRYSFNNDAYQRWFGRPAAEFTGERVDLMVGDSGYRVVTPYLDRAFAGETVVFEDEILYPEERSRFVHGTYIPDRDDAGAVRGVIAMVDDITERRRQEEELRRYAEHLARINAELAASNDELSQFAHVASHDLKEPLRMVKAYTQMLDARYREKFDERGRQYTGYIVEGATRMNALINDLLAYSAIGRAESPLGAADLGRAVSIALSNLREAIAQAEADVEVDKLPTVTGNESQLAQVFQNLIGNAVKFRGPGQPRIHVRAEKRPSDWLISVEDNGIGIEPEYLEKIFVIFQRLHSRGDYPGTGVGLAICKRIIERHGGRIWATSQPGKGSTFLFTVPHGTRG